MERTKWKISDTTSWNITHCNIILLCYAVYAPMQKGLFFHICLSNKYRWEKPMILTGVFSSGMEWKWQSLFPQPRALCFDTEAQVASPLIDPFTLTLDYALQAWLCLLIARICLDSQMWYCPFCMCSCEFNLVSIRQIFLLCVQEGITVRIALGYYSFNVSPSSFWDHLTPFYWLYKVQT